jgi:methionyl aminopeptidase
VFGRERVEYKTVEQVRAMRRAGLVVSAALSEVRATIAPGVTTRALDDVAARVIGGAGAKPSFLGYHGFPATICVSVNDEVVHGIPGSRVLDEGDVVSVDCGAIVDGWHGDSAFTVVVSAGSAKDDALVASTERAMWAGIAALSESRRVNEVGTVIERAVHQEAGRSGLTYGIVEDFVGHGIGTAMHQPPDVPNYRTNGRGARVRPGLCVAVEPMLTLGDQATRVCEDDWTVVTADGSRAAHWEHTVAVLEDGLFVLTDADGGDQRLGELGVRIATL